MAPDDTTGQDAEGATSHHVSPKAPSRPRRITSTMAFRTYLGTMDAIAAAFERGEVDEDEAWKAWDVARNVMVSYLADNVHVRFLHIKELRATGEAPPVDDQPSAVPG